MKETTLKGETQTEKSFTDILQLIWRFIRTHYRIYSNPSLFVEERGNYSGVGVVNPGFFLFLNTCIFLLLCTYAPLFGEATPDMNWSQLFQGPQEFLKHYSLGQVVLFYSKYVVFVLGGLLVVLALCFGGNKAELKMMPGVAAFLLVAVFDFLILRFVFALSIVKGSAYFRHAISLVSWRYHGVRFPELVCSFFVYPVLIMFYRLWKVKGEVVFPFLAGYVAVLVAVGFYFKKEVIHKDKRFPYVAATHYKNASDSTKSYLAIQKTVPVPIFQKDRPSNYSIRLASNPASDSVIHFKSYLEKNRYWLEASITLTNTTIIPIQFPKSNSALVHLSIGNDALLIQNKLLSKNFQFALCFSSDSIETLQGRDTRTVLIKIPISSKTHQYLDEKCNEGAQKLFKVFIELAMTENNNVIKVNRQTSWNIYFRKLKRGYRGGKW